MNTRTNEWRMSCGLAGLGCLIIVALSTTIISAAPRGADIKVTAAVEPPQLIAVRIRHDMCPFCKGFDAKFPKLIRDMKDASVLFVTLDLTTETTQRQAALLVSALGLEAVWTGDMTKMGTISFLDGKSKKVISSVHQTEVKEVRTALRKAITVSTRNG